MGSPLWLATLASHADVVKYLLLHGASVNSPGPRGDSALRVAEWSSTDALVAALFSGAKFWCNASPKEAQAEVDGSDGRVVHNSVCDRSGVQITGCLYHLRGFNFDVCEAEYAKLSEAEKGKYEPVPKPPRQLFEGELQQLCDSQGRDDLRSLLALVDESARVRARQRLAWATLMISDDDCLFELGIDLPGRIAEQLQQMPKTSASFNLKVISEESRGIGLSEENLKRLRSIERQLMPLGRIEVCQMLDAAGVVRSDATTPLLAAVESAALSRRDPREGIYKCVLRNGVGIRAEPMESTKRSHGPAQGQLIAVETVVIASTELVQEMSAVEVVQKDIDAALEQLRATMGAGIVSDMTREMDSLAPVEKLGQLSAIMPMQLPSQQAAPAVTHEIAYLQLVGGGYCPISLPNDNNPLFKRQSGLALDDATADPMDSPALAICAARQVAAAESCDGVLLCEWKRLQRYAAVWPGRPQCLASVEEFPAEIVGQQTLDGFLHAAKLAGYAEALAALGVSTRCSSHHNLISIC